MSNLSRIVHADMKAASSEDTRQGEAEQKAIKDIIKLHEELNKGQYDAKQQIEIIAAALLPIIDSFYDVGFDSCLKILSNGTIDLMQGVSEE